MQWWLDLRCCESIKLSSRWFRGSLYQWIFFVVKSIGKNTTINFVLLQDCYPMESQVLIDSSKQLILNLPRCHNVFTMSWNIQQHFQYHNTCLKWFFFFKFGQMHQLFSFHQRDPDGIQHISVNAGHTVSWNDKGGQTLANSCHQIISISILSIEF